MKMTSDLLRRLAAAFGIAILLCLYAPRHAAAQDIAAQERAAAAIEAGDCARALEILSAIMPADTRDTRAILLRAKAHEGLGNGVQAVADYERILDIEPGNVAARQALARLREPSAAHTDQLVELRAAADADPGSAARRLRLAEALYDAGSMEEAAAAYTAWHGLPGVQGTPDIIQRYLIALAAYDGDNQIGEQIATRYTGLFPTNDDLWMRLGYFRLWQAKWQGATAACEQALRLNERNAQANTCLQQVAERKEAERLATLQVAGTTTGPSTFIVDRLYRELRRNPGDDPKRFSLVEQLIKYRRYQEAYDQLMILERSYGADYNWLSLFVAADNGLEATKGRSPVYPIDRFTYRLRFDPSNAETRYALVNELAAADRLTEAIEVLTDPQHGSPAYARYAPLLKRLTAERSEKNRARIAVLESAVRNRPDDSDALRELAGLYQAEGRNDRAVATLAVLVRLNPANDAGRARYTEALLAAGQSDDALDQARRILDSQPDNPAYQRLYVLASLASGSLDDRAARAADHLVNRKTDADPGLLLDLAQYRLASGDLDGAENLVRRARSIPDTRFAARIEAAGQLIARERVRQARAGQFDLLAEARRLAYEKRFDDAVEAYERYFEARGGRSRPEMKELAQVYTASGAFDRALSVLQALEDQAWEYDVAKEIARNQIYREDYSGAIRSLEKLHAENPADYEVRFLQADAYRELGLFAQARDIVEEAERLSGTATTVERQVIDLDFGLRAGLAASGYDSGFDYVGIIAAMTDAVVARGGGTQYNRWTQGAQAHVTLPIGHGAVLMTGVNSHFLKGSRLLLSGSPLARGRVNQALAAGYLEMTPKLAELNHASYTNRLSFEGGLYDYEGGRTVGFGGIRYWRQDPGIYRGSIGLRTGEGSLDLWSPAGGEYNLRNTQLDLQAYLPNVMPDSTLRIAGFVALNSVTDNFGSLGSSTGSNLGTTTRLEGSYKVLGHTWVGVTWYQVSWRTTTDLYWSPRDYSSWDLFLEYEKNMPYQWYVRLRGAVGAISRSSGFIARRVELDLIRRLSTHFSLNVVGAMGQSTRTLGSGPTSYLDRYNTFSLSATLYWTL